MILFKVTFKNNIAIAATISHVDKQVEWKENTILSMNIYANNNIQAMEIAQKKANTLLKKKL